MVDSRPVFDGEVLCNERKKKFVFDGSLMALRKNLVKTMGKGLVKNLEGSFRELGWAMDNNRN